MKYNEMETLIHTGTIKDVVEAILDKYSGTGIYDRPSFEDLLARDGVEVGDLLFKKYTDYDEFHIGTIDKMIQFIFWDKQHRVICNPINEPYGYDKSKGPYFDHFIKTHTRKIPGEKFIEGYDYLRDLLWVHMDLWTILVQEALAD